MVNSRGFTLIELLLVVALIGIIASLATPALMRARHTAVDASTVASLRALVSAQAAYSQTCGAGYYAPTIANLSSGITKGYIGPEFRADTVDRQYYRFRYTAGTVAPRAPATCNGLPAGRTRINYFIGVDPIQVVAGRQERHYGTGQNGTIYVSRLRISAYLTGSPPAPAQPLK